MNPLTVCLPVYNGGPLLARQLLALLLEAQSQEFALVVVDNRSTDGSGDQARALLRLFRPHLNGVVVDGHRKQSLGYARNVAVEFAATPSVCFCDQDDVVLPGWIAAHARAASSSQLWTGRVLGDVLNARRTSAAVEADYSSRRVLGYGPSVLGSNFGLAKSLVDQIGGFSEDIPSCEDIEFSWRAFEQAGVLVDSAPDARVLRQFRGGVREIFGQGSWYGQGQGWLKDHYEAKGLPVHGWYRDPLKRLLHVAAAAAKGDRDAQGEFAHSLGIVAGRLRFQLAPGERRPR